MFPKRLLSNKSFRVLKTSNQVYCFDIKHFSLTAQCSCSLCRNSIDNLLSGKAHFSSNIVQTDQKTMSIDDILQNNKRWIAKSKEDDPQFFEKLGKGQKPKFLYFGCSDSRVSSNEILGLRPGEVFVHRNVGNLVLGNDLNSLSVLEYALDHLKVTDIIVTGHYECGAVRAATQRQDLGTLENWLRAIRDVYRLHKETLSYIADENERHRRLVELNVIEQCINIYKTGIFQRRRMQSIAADKKKTLENGEATQALSTQTPRIHALVFDPKDGTLKKLDVNFESRIGSLDHIYGLYERNDTSD